MPRKFLKLFLFYYISYGILGMVLVFSDGLFDHRINGDFFLRTSVWDFFHAFFVVPFSALKSLINFSLSNWEVHLVFILFLGISIFGLYKNSNVILIAAGLIPILWGVSNLII